MEDILSPWALAALIRKLIKSWLANIDTCVSRKRARRIRAALREMEAEIRNGLATDAAALEIAPHTPAPQQKRDSKPRTAPHAPAFRITLPAPRPSANSKSSAPGVLSEDIPAAPLQARFARAEAVIDAPAPYAKRLAMRLARQRSYVPVTPHLIRGPSRQGAGLQNSGSGVQTTAPKPP